MKKLTLILLIGLLRIGTINSQCCPYLGDVEIIPENPTTSDSIYLITNVTTPNAGSYLGYEIENGLDNDITVRACYWEGMLTVLTTFIDTINLGVQDMGTYSLNFVALSSINSTDCVSIDSNSVELTFGVSGTNAINNMESFNVSCFPNPILDQNMWIYSSTRIQEVIIMNTSGKVIFEVDGLDTDYYEVDENELSMGINLIKIIDQKSNESIRKVIKLE